MIWPSSGALRMVRVAVIMVGEDSRATRGFKSTMGKYATKLKGAGLWARTRGRG
jgi:hypothetical protein